LRFGQALLCGQSKPAGRFLVILDHTIVLGIAHAQLQLGLGIAFLGSGVGHADGFLCGSHGVARVDGKPGCDTNQCTEGCQQQHRLQGIERPEAMAAVAAAQGRVQQEVADPVMGMQRTAANLVASALGTDVR